MVPNPDKCPFTLLGVKDELQSNLASNNVTINKSSKGKVLGIIFDCKLDFSIASYYYYQKGEFKSQCPYQSTKISIQKSLNLVTVVLSGCFVQRKLFID